MVENPTEGGNRGTSRRLFLQFAAATGTIAGISSSGIAQRAEITLEGHRDGWVGRSPEDIADERNPTLRVQAGETHTLTWENTDGRPHNVVIADAEGTELERTEIIEGEGETQSLEFEATPEMSTYYCEVHPDSMRGSIETNGDTDADSPAETEEQGQGISEGFSAGQLAGDLGPNPVETNASGAALFGLSEDGTELRYVLMIAEIERVTQAHIHLGSADEDGDVVAWLFGRATDRSEDDERAAFVEPLKQGVSGSGVLAEGVITEDRLVGPLEGESLDALLEELRGETAYVNVHTAQHPGGEIRGQIGSVDAVNVELTERVDATVTADETLQVDTRTTFDVLGPGTEPDSNGAEEPATAENGEPAETEGDIELSYEGSVEPGSTVTITATADGEPVANADVEVEGDGDRRVGQTDENGQIAVEVPASGDRAGELRVSVRDGEREGELEVEDDD